MLDWQAYTRMSDAELAQCDIAEMNLACAMGLPGSEHLDAKGLLEALDRWSEAIGRRTPEAIETTYKMNPGLYENSEAVFRMACIVLTLQRHCGVGYNPAKTNMKLEDPYEYDDMFIHGAMQGLGTCASLPVVYAAVGRRLGYPMKLARTKMHLYNRWDAPNGDHYNLDGSNTLGFSSEPDEHYSKQWKYPVCEDEIKKYSYLKSLSPREELASFIANRAVVLLDLGEFDQSAQAYIAALKLEPASLGYQECLEAVQYRWSRVVLKRVPPGFPKTKIRLRGGQRHWPWIPLKAEFRMHMLRSDTLMLNDSQHERLHWEPLRNGRTPITPVPTTVLFTPARVR